MAWGDFTAALVGVWIWPALILLKETSSLAAMAISLPVFVGGGLAIRFTTINLLRAIEHLRQKRWLRSDDAKRYGDYSSRRDDIVRARLATEEAERREQEGRLRRELAENSTKREYLLGLSPVAFEEHVGKLFLALGYKVRVTPRSNDKGVDLYLDKGGRRSIVQCKRYRAAVVGRPEIQQTFGVLRDEKASEAFVVTTSGFSRQAKEFVEGKPIRLIDLPMLVRMGESAFTEEFVRSGPTPELRRRGHTRYRRRH